LWWCVCVCVCVCFDGVCVQCSKRRCQSLPTGSV